MSEPKTQHTKKSWRWYIYIIECDDGSYYTGITWSPDRRWTQHLSGLGGAYTQEHPPVALRYLEEHNDLETARTREVQIKGWTRSKKERLFSGEWAGTGRLSGFDKLSQ